MQNLFIVGNLGNPAEQKQVGDQTVVEFSVAVNRKVKGVESTTWYRCSWWGQAGIGVQPYLTKGKKVAVAGDLNVREYEGKSGAGTSLDVRVYSLTLCDGPSGEKQEQQAPRRESYGGGGGSRKPAGGGGGAPPNDYADPDDIPFITTTPNAWGL